MTDTPERIWAWEYGASAGDPEGLGEWYTEDFGIHGQETEYVRKDLYNAAIARAEAAEAEVERLREALLSATAHLAGAASAYKNFAARHPKWGIPDDDALYGTRFKDFDNAVERARAALKQEN